MDGFKWMIGMAVVLLSGCGLLEERRNSRRAAQEPARPTTGVVEVFLSGDERIGDRLVPVEVGIEGDLLENVLSSALESSQDFSVLYEISQNIESDLTGLEPASLEQASLEQAMAKFVRDQALVWVRGERCTVFPMDLVLDSGLGSELVLPQDHLMLVPYRMAEERFQADERVPGDRNIVVVYGDRQKSVRAIAVEDLAESGALDDLCRDTDIPRPNVLLISNIQNGIVEQMMVPVGGVLSCIDPEPYQPGGWKERTVIFREGDVVELIRLVRDEGFGMRDEG